MTLPAIDKPRDAGSGTVAIISTRSHFVNIRTGPGTNYADVGDIRDNSLVVYYPNTRTSDDWYWVEHRGLAGWVAGFVVAFTPAVGGQPRPDQPPTPFDGKSALWYWKGESTAETSIENLVAKVKGFAPSLKQLWVKTSDGANWMGDFDENGGEFAIHGPEDIDRWVSVLQRFDMEFCAWCVPQGRDIDAEAAIISAACNRPGVQAMILDVEPYQGFWTVGPDPVRPLMLKVRGAIDPRFHIGMSMDPRPWHYDSIYPAEWQPFIGSLHPQTYWRTFRDLPEETLETTWQTWQGLGLPIVPAFQGDAPRQEQETAHTLATQQYGAPGISYWRYGVISQWSVINRPVELQTSPAEPLEEDLDNYTDEVIVLPGEAGFRGGTYTGRQEFQSFTGTSGWKTFYKNTEVTTSKVWVEWKTEMPSDGRYEIAVYVPARHSTTRRARYKIHGIKGTTTEVVIDINQAQNRNLWVPLGVFELVKDMPNAGKVFLNDVTGEPDQEIAFDAVRFRRIVTVPADKVDETVPDDPDTGGGDGPDVIGGVNVADGFDSPVGTLNERRGSRVWPSGWRDASPFAQLYFVGTPSQAYHTGADLNWGSGPWDDQGVAVYAPASGIVIYQAYLRPWGNVTIIKHDPLKSPGGKVMYTRYGHMQNVSVRVGQRVTRGQQIGEIGNGGGRFIPHLHYDIVATNVLEIRPGDWPGMDLNRLLAHYVDPQIFTQNNRP